MGTAAVERDDPMLRLRYYRETGQADKAQTYEEYLRETGQFVSDATARLRSDQKAGILDERMARANTNDREMAEATTPGYATQVLGGISSLVRDIPGVEAVAAGARAGLRGQSYREARDDIRGAQEDAPGLVRNYNRVVGGALAAAGLPGSAVRQGATFGAASGLLQSDPDAGIVERGADAAIAGTVGAGAGQVANLVGTGLRAAFGKSLGANAVERRAAMGAADARNYGAAAAEAANAPPQSILALRQPDIAPTADAVRNSRQFAGADDATVLREVYPRLSEQQGTLVDRVANAVRAKPSLSGESAEIALAKKELLDAADPIMPSYRGAVAEHARHARELDALGTGADAAKRIMSGSSGAGKKLTKNSPEAFEEAVRRMSPDEAGAATEGVAGRLRESLGLSFNPFSGFGVGSSLRNLSRVGPVFDQLDAVTGRLPDQRLLRAAGISVGTPQLTIR